MRKLLFIFAGLVMFTVLAYFYVNNVFFPVKLKEFLIKKSSKTLGRTVSLESIRFEPIRGFILEDIEIFEKDNPTEVFLKIEEASFNVVFAALWKEKSVILPSIIIKKPILKIDRLSAESFNFSDILNKNAAGEKNEYQIFLRKLSVQNATIHYLDHTDPEVFEETFTKTNFEAVINLNKTIQFKFSTTPPNDASSARAEGTYDIASKSVQANVTLRNILLYRYAPLFNITSFSIPAGTVSAADLQLQAGLSPLKITGGGQLGLLNNEFIFGNMSLKAKNIYTQNTTVTFQENAFNFNGSLNASGLNVQISPTQGFEADMSTTINGLTLTNGTVTANGSITLTDSIFRNGNQTFKSNISSELLKLTYKDGEITLGGDLASLNNDFQLAANQTFKSDAVNCAGLQLTKNDSRTQLTFGFTASNAQAQISDAQSLSGQLSSPQTSVDLQSASLSIISQLNTENIIYKNGPVLTAQGSPALTINVQTDTIDPTKLKYSGQINAAGMQITGVEAVNALTVKNGTVNFSESSVSTLDALIESLGTTIKISGSLTDFTNPVIDANITSESVDADVLMPFIPNDDIKNNWQIHASPQIDLTLKGPLRALSLEHITAAVKFKDAAVTGKPLPAPIEHISGQINAAENILSWHGLTGTFKGDTFTLNGKLSGEKKAPLVDLKVESSKDNKTKLSFTSQLRILNNAFQIQLLQGDFYLSSFDLKGDVKLSSDKKPNFDIRGAATVFLEDLKYISAPLREKLEPLGLKGSVSVEGLFKGAPDNWQDWQISLAASAPKITVADHPFETVDFKITQRDQHISKLDLTAFVYGGSLQATSQVDLRNPALNFISEVLLQNLDIARLHAKKSPKNKNLSGSLSAKASANGSFNKPESIVGKGNFTIIDGYLGKIIPQFEEAYFTDAAGSFNIKDKKIQTEDTLITSKTIILNARGYIDFEKNLNFEVIPKLSEVVIAKEESLKVDPSHILSKAINIKITGTLDKPKYSFVTSPVKILENTSTIIRDGIGTILKDLF